MFWVFLVVLAEKDGIFFKPVCFELKL